MCCEPWESLQPHGWDEFHPTPRVATVTTEKDFLEDWVWSYYVHCCLRSLKIVARTTHGITVGNGTANSNSINTRPQDSSEKEGHYFGAVWC